MKKFYEDNPTIRKDRMVKRYQDNPNLGKEHSEKLKAHYRNNPQARKAVSERTTKWLNENHPRARKIINTETGEIFKSVVQVSKLVNKSIQTVRNWVNEVSPNPTFFKYL